MAQKLGFVDYNAFKNAAAARTTIINGGYINTQLIEANAITADMINATNLHVNSANIDGTITATNLNAATGTFTGTLSAATGSFSGSITANSGQIGGFTIDTSKLYNGLSTLNGTSEGVYLGTDGIALGGGKFKVTKEGDITAVGLSVDAAYITGTLAASHIDVNNLAVKKLATTGSTSSLSIADNQIQIFDEDTNRRI